MLIDIEKEQEFKSPVHKMMKGSYFYENTGVRKSREIKYCKLCGTKIPIGSTSNGDTLFDDDFYQVDFCKPCEEKYKVELALMRNGDLDDYR